MLDELRNRMAAYLARHQVCVISIIGPQKAWAMPAWYCSHGLEVDCLLPRWTEVAYHLEQDPRAGPGFVGGQGQQASPEPGRRASPEPGRRVILMIRDVHAAGLRWLQCLGTGQLVEKPDWDGLLPAWTSAAPPDELYLVIRVTPQRLDLFDESRGWGAHETLEL